MGNRFCAFSTLTLISLTACGGAYTGPTGTTKTTSSVSSSSAASTTSESSSYSNTAGNGNAPLVYLVEGSGYNSVSVTVSAGSVLKVKFTPNVQDRTVASTGYTVQYSQLGVYLAAGSMTAAPTPMLGNGLYGGTQQTSGVIDLSAGIPTSGCTGTPCRVPVTITISQPNSDGQCLSGNPYACPWSHVVEGVPWNGTLKVQTDDTEAL